MRMVAAVFLTLGLSGCAVFEDVMSFEDDDGQTARVSVDQHAALIELSISTGRYGVMLGQARDILRLPEPAMPTGDSVSGPADDQAQERSRIATEQARVAAEFLEHRVELLAGKSGLVVFVAKHGAFGERELGKRLMRFFAGDARFFERGDDGVLPTGMILANVVPRHGEREGVAPGFVRQEEVL